MKSVDLPIYHQDSVAAPAKLGLVAYTNECSVRTITFYSIGGVGPFFDENRALSCIYANGTVYISPLNCRLVNKLIKKHL